VGEVIGPRDALHAGLLSGRFGVPDFRSADQHKQGHVQATLQRYYAVLRELELSELLTFSAAAWRTLFINYLHNNKT
jgi:hypothetical protein